MALFNGLAPAILQPRKFFAGHSDEIGQERRLTGILFLQRGKDVIRTNRVVWEKGVLFTRQITNVIGRNRFDECNVI